MKLLHMLLTVACLSCFALGAGHSYADTSEQNRPTSLQQSKLNINQVTVEQLVQIKGVGIKKAQAIIKFREQVGNIKRLEELLAVKGVGEKLLSKLQQHLKV